MALKVCSKDAMDLLTSSKKESRSKFLKQQYLYFFNYDVVYVARDNNI